MTFRQLGYWGVTALFVWFWYMFCTNPNLHIDWCNHKNMGMTEFQSASLFLLCISSFWWIILGIISPLLDWDGWDEPIFKHKKK